MSFIIPYDTARELYIAAHIISIISAIVLLLLYVQQAHNLLLQSCCGAIMLLSLITLFDTLSHTNRLSPVYVHITPSFRAAFSAASISYMTNVVHAHLAFLMLHSCAQACGWPLFRMRKGSFLTRVYLMISYMFPLLFYFWVIGQEADVKTRSAVMNGFHWAIYHPAWATRFQSCVFAYMGSFFSIYLLYRFTRLRVSSLDQNLITQLSPRYLLRIMVTTFLYLLIAMSAVYPFDSDTRKVEYLAKFRRPAAYNYIVALIGLLLFAMFGCGSPARKAFREIMRWFASLSSSDQDEEEYDHELAGRGLRGSFTVISEEDDEEIMDFESALMRTMPEDEQQRYSYKGWSSSRRSSDPLAKTAASSASGQISHSKLCEHVESVDSSRTSQ